MVHLHGPPRSNAIQYFFSISQSSSDLGGESSLGGKDRLAFPQFVTAIARIAEEIVLKDHLVATMSERLHYLCQHLEQKIQRYEKTGGGCCWVFVFFLLWIFFVVVVALTDCGLCWYNLCIVLIAVNSSGAS